MKFTRGKWFYLVSGVLLCLLLGMVSGLSGAGGDGAWYRGLVKPPGTPPSWLFGPVWTVLYLMMGVVLGRLFHRKAWQALWVFGMQMVLNLMWTPVFFGGQRIDVALAVISGLWFGISALIQIAWKVDKFSSLLLIPYLVWVSYASYLNAGFYWLNC